MDYTAMLIVAIVFICGLVIGAILTVAIIQRMSSRKADKLIT